MGQHPSAVVDDGQSSIHRQSYTVRGDLYSRSITASTINARVVYARRITCQKAQISRQEPLRPDGYPNPPHRSVAVHTLNVDVLYADEINCKTLRCYDVFVGEGEQWRAKRVEWLDRNQVGWDGKEDDESDASDSEEEQDQNTQEARSNRKKMLGFGAAGALGIALGGAALAYNHHKKGKKEEEEKEREKEELRRREEEDERRRREDDDRRRQEDENRRHREDEDRRRREDEDRRRQEQNHHAPPPYQQPMAPEHHSSRGGGGNFHMSSKNVRLWSDGNHCFLIAECDAGNGRSQESRIDLDEIITNRNGEFAWVHRGETGNFSGTTERWEIVDGGSTMAGYVRNVHGEMNHRKLVLSDRITNENGNLKYLG